MIWELTPAERFPRFAACSLAALLGVLFTAILTLWIQTEESWLPGVFECAICALAALWTARMACSSVPAQFNLVLVPMAAPIAVGAVQLAASTTVYRWATWAAVVQWGSYVAAAFLALQICSSGRVLARFRRVILYFGFAIAVVSILQLFTSPDKVFWMFQAAYPEPSLGPFVSPDRYAAFVELLLPIALYEAFAGKRVVLSYTAMAATLLASVIAGASRAGSILVVAESAALLLLMSGSRRFRSPQAGKAAASFVVFGIAFTAIVGWTHLWERFQAPDPFRYRREMFASSVAMVRERPWTGFGLGTFETVYPGYALFDNGEVVNHAHNDWIEWAVEGGLPMLVPLLCVFLLLARRALQRPWLLGVLSILIHSAIDFPMQDPALALWTFALLGAGFSPTPDNVEDAVESGPGRRAVPVYEG